jgi:hypothetical protein
MAQEPTPLMDSIFTQVASARGLYGRVSDFLTRATFKISAGTPQQTIAALAASFGLGEADQKKLADLCATKSGAAFFAEKVETMDREATHRSAFALNALMQLLFVDLAAQIGLSFFTLKLLLTAANVLIAILAHLGRRQALRELLDGPNALPSKRRLFGLVANKSYNKAVKRNSQTHAETAWKEASIYRVAYYVNAATLFLGAEFILSPSKLIFPFSLVVGKLSGLFSTFVMLLDAWCGFKASEDSRRAREKEVAVYRDLDV